MDEEGPKRKPWVGMNWIADERVVVRARRAMSAHGDQSLPSEPGETAQSYSPKRSTEPAMGRPPGVVDDDCCGPEVAVIGFCVAVGVEALAGIVFGGGGNVVVAVVVGIEVLVVAGIARAVFGVRIGGGKIEEALLLSSLSGRVKMASGVVVVVFAGARDEAVAAAASDGAARTRAAATKSAIARRGLLLFMGCCCWCWCVRACVVLSCRCKQVEFGVKKNVKKGGERARSRSCFFFFVGARERARLMAGAVEHGRSGPLRLCFFFFSRPS
jgi:hypothetical protein